MTLPNGPTEVLIGLGRLSLAGHESARYRPAVRESADDLAAKRFRLALDLFELAEAMMRQKLRRQYPEATETEIEAEVVAWRGRRPGAESGDCPGQPRCWPPS